MPDYTLHLTRRACRFSGAQSSLRPKRRNAALVLGAAAGLAVGGCATHRVPDSELPAQELTGHYVSGPGESWFSPCSAAPGDASWWVTVTGGAVEQFDRARSAGQIASKQRYFVRWRSAVTTAGEIGPRGPGAPALLVRELIELRPAADDDCGQRQRTSGPGA